MRVIVPFMLFALLLSACGGDADAGVNSEATSTRTVELTAVAHAQPQATITATATDTPMATATATTAATETPTTRPTRTPRPLPTRTPRPTPTVIPTATPLAIALVDLLPRPEHVPVPVRIEQEQADDSGASSPGFVRGASRTLFIDRTTFSGESPLITIIVTCSEFQQTDQSRAFYQGGLEASLSSPAFDVIDAPIPAIADQSAGREGSFITDSAIFDAGLVWVQFERFSCLYLGLGEHGSPLEAIVTTAQNAYAPFATGTVDPTPTSDASDTALHVFLPELNDLPIGATVDKDEAIPDGNAFASVDGIVEVTRRAYTLPAPGSIFVADCGSFVSAERAHEEAGRKFQEDVNSPGFPMEIVSEDGSGSTYVGSAYGSKDGSLAAVFVFQLHTSACWYFALGDLDFDALNITIDAAQAVLDRYAE